MHAATRHVAWAAMTVSTERFPDRAAALSALDAHRALLVAAALTTAAWLGLQPPSPPAEPDSPSAEATPAPATAPAGPPWRYGRADARFTVVEYADLVTAKGFVFMDTPGYDPVSATGQVAGGANLICFTTGRGSVYGCKPSPSIKLATNTPLYERMTEDMDINCGEIVDGTVSVQEKGREIFELILQVASGEATRSEALGMGNDEFVPWQLGAVM